MKTFKHLRIPESWEHYWTKYPEGYTILESLMDWVSHANEVTDNVNEWNKYLDDFVNQFDKNLQNKIIDTLSEWQKDGTLDIIIDEALQTQIDNLEIDMGVNVFKYGAVGDGVTDDTEAFLSAIGSGHKLYVPSTKGGFLIKQTLPLQNSIRGEQGTRLIFDVDSNSDGVVATKSGLSIENLIIEQFNDLRNTSDYNDESGYGIRLEGDNVEVTNITVDGFTSGVLVNGFANNIIKNSFIYTIWRGVLVTRSATNTIIDTNKINLREDRIPTDVPLYGANGILTKHPSIGTTIKNNTIENTIEHGIYFQGSDGTVENNRFKKDPSFRGQGDGIKVSCPDLTGGGISKNNKIVANVIEGYKRGIYCEYSYQDIDIDSNIINIPSNVNAATINQSDGIALNAGAHNNPDINLVPEGVKVSNNTIRGYHRNGILSSTDKVEIFNNIVYVLYESQYAISIYANEGKKASGSVVSNNIYAEIDGARGIYVQNVKNMSVTNNNLSGDFYTDILVSTPFKQFTYVRNNTVNGINEDSLYSIDFSRDDQQGTLVSLFVNGGGTRYIATNGGKTYKLYVHTRYKPTGGDFYFVLFKNGTEALRVNIKPEDVSSTGVALLMVDNPVFIDEGSEIFAQIEFNDWETPNPEQPLTISLKMA